MREEGMRQGDGRDSEGEKKEDEKAKLFKKAGKYFQVIGTIIFLSVSCIFINIFDFRQHAKAKQIFIVQPYSYLWCALSFILHLILKRSFVKISQKFFENFLHPRSRMNGSQYFKEKLYNFSTQTYQFCYHLLVVLVAFYYCREEHWFPQVLGGQGSCSNLTNDYPQWPSNNSNLAQVILIYFQIQLGTSFYLVIEVIFLQRQRLKESNYGEMVYHHFVTISLILVTLHFNFIPMAINVFFVHDLSDMWRGVSRIFGESKYCIIYPRLGTFFNQICLIVWVAMRVMIFPICIINNFHEGTPSYDSQFSEARFAGWFVTTFLTGLYFLQCYWAMNIFRSNKSQTNKNKAFIAAYQAQTKKIKDI